MIFDSRSANKILTTSSQRSIIDQAFIKMDTSLINLIPNLTARRSATVPRCEFVDPPPPYTLAPYPSPQREDNTRSTGIPLHIDIVDTSWPEALGKRPVIWSGDDSVAVGPHMTYREFLEILQRKLDDVKVPQNSGEWKAGIEAEIRGRSVWQFKRQVVYVTPQSWHKVMEGLEEGRFKGFRVTCWRGEVMGEIGN